MASYLFSRRRIALIELFLCISTFSIFTSCDARSLQEMFKIRNGLKQSFYNSETDTLDLDIPTIDSYSWVSFPPLANEYGSQLPLTISNPPEIAPSPYVTRFPISGPPANQPISAHIDPIGPYNGPKKPLPSLRPAASPGPIHVGWCVARPTVPEPLLQRAMDYACGTGAECSPIRPNGPCFEPNSLMAHASYAFNSYWQRTKIQGGTCEFGGIAMLITIDPSFSGCKFVYT